MPAEAAGPLPRRQLPQALSRPAAQLLSHYLSVPCRSGGLTTGVGGPPGTPGGTRGAIEYLGGGTRGATEYLGGGTRGAHRVPGRRGLAGEGLLGAVHAELVSFGVGCTVQDSDPVWPMS